MSLSALLAWIPFPVKKICAGRSCLKISVFLVAASLGYAYPQGTKHSSRVVPPGEESAPSEILRIDTDLVPIDVNVTDAKGQAVLGLGRQDFKIFEDGNERPVAFFNVSKKEDLTRPLAVVFAMDVSGSMTEGEMARVRDAMTAFADGLGERPSAFSVMSFGMHVRVLQKFTPDREKLYRAFDLASREKEGLSTHAYDAVDDAIRLLVRKAPRVRDGRLVKKAVILITDGFPVGDTVEPKTVIERAVDAGVSVYSVTLPSYTSSVLTDDRVPLPTPLDVSDLVEKTGGCNVYAWGTNYQDLFRRLAEDVTSSYVLAFYPPEANRVDGRYHSIRVGGPVGVTLRQSRNGYTSKER